MKGIERLRFSLSMSLYYGPHSGHDMLHYKSCSFSLFDRQGNMDSPPRIASIATPKLDKHDLTKIML
jgi:hypothetical protein